MSTFNVSGSWNARDGWQRFEKTVDAANEDVAVERVYAEFGSRYSLQRTQVEIGEVEA